MSLYLILAPSRTDSYCIYVLTIIDFDRMFESVGYCWNETEM